MFSIPEYVTRVIETLHSRGYQAYLVGGAVRDLMLQRTPGDWDVATDATPEQVEGIFGDLSIPTGKRFGTITVKSYGSQGDENFLEVTTFRSDGVYSDGRRPDAVTFSRDILEDLGRRDFTVNAIAYDIYSGKVIDPFQGARDIARRRIVTVGAAQERFREDALRMLRAIRLAAELDFEVSPGVMEAIQENSGLIKNVAWERIRDEMSKLLISERPKLGVELLRRSTLLGYIRPELLETVDVAQGEGHLWTVYRHSLEAAQNIEPELHLRLAALLHDVGKPRTKVVNQAGEVHFYRHEIVGAEMARGALVRLRYPSEFVERVALLIEKHMFYYDAGCTDRAIRRLIGQVGLDAIYDLAKLRRADRIATGTREGLGANMQAFLERVESVLAKGKVFTVTDLAVDGHDVMEVLDIPEGPRVGAVLQRLLDAVMERPSLNTREDLLKMLEEMRETEGSRKWDETGSGGQGDATGATPGA